MFKSIFSFSSRTCFFKVFFYHPRLLLPFNRKSKVIFKTLSSSILSSCLLHIASFAFANPSTVFISPASFFFLFATFRPPVVLAESLSVLVKIFFHFLLKHYISLAYIIVDLMQQQQYTLSFIFSRNL